MKPLLFFITFIFIFILLSLFSYPLIHLSSYPPLVSAAQSRQVNVSAYVDEYLNFTIDENKLSISTNYQSGFWLISKNNFQSIRPGQQIFNLPEKTFYLIINF